jgi:hypothetical protein
MTDRDTDQTEAQDSSRLGAIRAFESSRGTAVDTLSQAPLLALAGGLAAGALIAALLPRTEAETRLVRPTARRVKNSARAAAEAARDTSKQRFEELGFTREQGSKQLHSFLDGLRDTAKASADAALQAVRNQD